MNRNKLFKGLFIFTATLLAGFGITALSFSLFDVLTQNQMRLLFAADVLLLIGIAAAVWLITEAGKAKRKKTAQFEERHSKRISKRNSEMQDIEIILAKNKYAA